MRPKLLRKVSPHHHGIIGSGQTFSNRLNECNSGGQRGTSIILEVDDTDGMIFNRPFNWSYVARKHLGPRFMSSQPFVVTNRKRELV